jgi:hypothetical protein
LQPAEVDGRKLRIGSGNFKLRLLLASIGVGHRDLIAGFLEFSFCGRDVGACQIRLGDIVARVEFNEQLARCHLAVVVDMQRLHVGRDLGDDRDGMCVDIRVVRLLFVQVGHQEIGGDGQQDKQYPRAEEQPASFFGAAKAPDALRRRAG